MRCRTKEGELRLLYEDKEYLLDVVGLDLPDDLAESIRGHVNVIVEPLPADSPSKEPEPEPEPKAAEDSDPDPEPKPKRTRRSRLSD